ncbi:hypothetical protein C8R43DRAFT_933925 [Mycena crocata]|nr:hypothetical protein C8R43DRAFT_933925 [Mycena crocata]
MLVNSAAENAFGTLGTICWTVHLLPQIWKTWREKSTKGLSPWLMLTWGTAGGVLGAYAIILNLNIPLIAQPQLFGTLCLISWGQCQYYGNNRSRNTAIGMTVGVMALVGGLEAMTVFVTRPPYLAGTRPSARAVQFLGILSSLMISLALLPQYVEIWRLREVLGISLIFMAVDMLGGVFSDLSLAFKDKFDIVASITYTLVVILDGVVVVAALILNPRAKRRRLLEDQAATVSPATEPPSETTTRPASLSVNAEKKEVTVTDGLNLSKEKHEV